jgi:hypothetical protein
MTAGNGVTFLYDASVVSATPTPTPTPSPTSGPRFTLGEVPKQGFGTVAFSGGKSSDLVTASSTAGCVVTTSAYFVFVSGTFLVYLPAAPAMVNAAWETYFAGSIPIGQLIVMRCVV